MDTEMTLELAMKEAHAEVVEEAKVRFVSNVRNAMREVKNAAIVLADAKERLAGMEFEDPKECE